MLITTLVTVDIGQTSVQRGRSRTRCSINIRFYIGKTFVCHEGAGPRGPLDEWAVLVIDGQEGAVRAKRSARPCQY